MFRVFLGGAMDLGISGKLGLVTASSAGMGRNIAYALAAEGVDLMLFARSTEKLHEVAREIENRFGTRVIPVPGDMRVAADVERLATVVKQSGGLDILVLNTGRPPSPLRAILDEHEQARWDEAYQTQLHGALLVVRHVVPLMLGRGWGRIVAITSASVKQPMSEHGLSTVFRAGVAACMKHLANEIGPQGITVNCVAPALIDTSHRAVSLRRSSGENAQRAKLTPLGRLGSQDEVTGTVVFLTSMQAGFVTGATLQVDGGMSSALC